MLHLNNIESILNFAIDAEQEAYDFYMNLAAKLSNKEMKKIFEGFAMEESGHKAKLMKLKEEGVSKEFSNENIADLKMETYIENTKPTADITYQDALILAMKKEKSAFRIYSGLASIAKNEQMKNVFLMLAQEEAKHKLRFEIEYDEFVLREN
jgi:rubrerythrin